MSIGAGCWGRQAERELVVRGWSRIVGVRNSSDEEVPVYHAPRDMGAPPGSLRDRA